MYLLSKQPKSKLQNSTMWILLITLQSKHDDNSHRASSGDNSGITTIYTLHNNGKHKYDKKKKNNTNKQ
jgi:hypothetical protein